MFQINNFFDQLCGFIKDLESGGFDDAKIKENLQSLLERHFQDSASKDDTSKKIDRINLKAANIIQKADEYKAKANKGLNNADVANQLAEKTKAEAEAFDKNANELASLVGGSNWMMIGIVIVAGLLLSVAVFTNLYATINGPPPKRHLTEAVHSMSKVSFDDFSLRVDHKQIFVEGQRGFKYSKGLFI